MSGSSDHIDAASGSTQDSECFVQLSGF